MSSYKPQSRDTSEDVERRVFDRYRAMTPAEKIRIVRGLFQASERLALAGARSRDPHASPEELRMRVAATRLTPKVMREVFGWVPPDRR